MLFSIIIAAIAVCVDCVNLWLYWLIRFRKVRAELIPLVGGCLGCVAILTSGIEHAGIWSLCAFLIDPGSCLVLRFLLGRCCSLALQIILKTPCVLTIPGMSHLMRILMAWETVDVCLYKSYRSGGAMVRIGALDFTQSQVLECDKFCHGRARHAAKGLIRVVDDDVLEAAQKMDRPLVLSFANAHVPGGGFWLGAASQEESICRRSTLYASLTAKSSAKLYRANNWHPRLAGADLIVYSPRVLVFRDVSGHFLKSPYEVSVASCAAPNRRFLASLLSSDKLVGVFRRRIRAILSLARDQGHRNIVLGAWGCGSFGNDPELVAECFRYVLVDEGYSSAFDEVVFAISGRRSRSMRDVFTSVLGEC